MMLIVKKRSCCPVTLFAAFAVWLALSGNAHVHGQEIPNANDVILDYVEALGGEMQLQSLSSYKLTGTYVGREFVVHYHHGTMCWVAMDGLYVYWLDEKGRFWQRHDGVFSLYKPVSPGYPSGFINLPVYANDWLCDGNLKVTNLGAGTLNGASTWRILFELEGRDSAERHFDQQSGLLLQTHQSGSELIFSYEYSNLNGYLFATTTQLKPTNATLTFHKVDVEPDHGDLKFEMPEELEKEWQRTQAENKPDSNDSAEPDEDGTWYAGKREVALLKTNKR